VVYFNVDYTYGLSNRLIGEADWAVINLGNGKIYNTILDLIKNNDKMEDASSLLQLF
jgi:hypothetical protein